MALKIGVLMQREAVVAGGLESEIKGPMKRRTSQKKNVKKEARNEKDGNNERKTAKLYCNAS